MLALLIVASAPRDSAFGEDQTRWIHEEVPCYSSSVEVIEAEFKNGVLHPMRRLALRPGERVGIVLVRRPDPARWDLARLSKPAGRDEAGLAEKGLTDWASALDREDQG